MIKYYTRACNFYYGSISKEKIKKKLSLPLNGNNLISFDNIEIITRKYKKKIHIKEIRKLVDEGYNQAKQILSSKIDDLHKIAKALLTYETLTGEEIENIINKNKYPTNKEDLKVEEDKDSSALGSIGLKPKIVH